MNDLSQQDRFSAPNVVAFDPPGGFNPVGAKLGAAPGGEAEPPNSIDSEQALLGAILLNAEALDRVRDHVTADDFYDPVHRHIYEVMGDRRDAGDTIDFNMMKAVLGNADLGGLTVGGYMANLIKGATNIASAPDYARLITHASNMRKILTAANTAIAAMTSGSILNPNTYAAAMIEQLDVVASSGLSEGMKRVTLGEATAGVIQRIDRVRKGQEPPGVSFGLPSLDRSTLGMRPGQLIILAARPAMGKTATAIHMALAGTHHGPIGFISLEMNADELGERVLSATAYRSGKSEISYRAIAEATGLRDDELSRISDAHYDCRKIPLWIEQQPGLMLSQIAARARQMKMRAERMGNPMAALIVDHIGLIRPSGRYKGNRVQEMTEISGGLKCLAKELCIPVIALCQLNRGVEMREDKHPMLADLRDSGSIEQDADLVLALYRESYYLEKKADRTDEEEMRLLDVRDTLEIGLLKQRSGPTFWLTCFFNAPCNVLAEIGR